MANSRLSLSLLAIIGFVGSGCVRALDQTSEYACEADSDCPSGSTCFAEQGHTLSDGDGICGVKGVACVDSEDCTRPALCRRPAPPGSGQTRSVLGKCELPPAGVECFVDEDCLTGEECVPKTGRCTEKGRICEQDSDCVTGQFCWMGYDQGCRSIYCTVDQECFPYRCGGDRRCGDYCSESGDCAAGAVCKARDCVAQ